MLKLLGILALVAVFVELSSGPAGGFPLVVTGERGLKQVVMHTIAVVYEGIPIMVMNRVNTICDLGLMVFIAVSNFSEFESWV